MVASSLLALSRAMQTRLASSMTHVYVHVWFGFVWLVVWVNVGRGRHVPTQTYGCTHHLVLLLVQAALQPLVDVVEDDAVLAQPVDALAQVLVLFMCVWCVYTVR